MRLIDKETGKRLKKEDPLQKQPEKGEEGKEMSPMDPPDAFQPPDNLEPVPYEQMPKVLQLLMDEHRDVLEAIGDFKELLDRYKEQGWKMSQADNQAFYSFLDTVDQAVLDHNEREEKIVFPTLAERLKEHGEHNQHLFEESQEKTGVDILEDDHAEFVQLSALLREFYGIVGGLPDEDSRVVVSDLIYQQGHQLANMLHLHIFREDQVLFPLAVQCVKEEEFAEMEREMDATLKHKTSV